MHRNLFNTMENEEIERKFLVVDNRFIEESIRHYDIVQGYICRMPGRTIRIRHRLGSDGTEIAKLTIKAAPKTADSITRFEWERDITAADFKALLGLCDGIPILKTRYIIPAKTAANSAHDEKTELQWEVDVFHGRHEGLVLAEIELPSEDTAFAKPEWLGKEVTDNPQYYNANM